MDYKEFEKQLQEYEVSSIESNHKKYELLKSALDSGDANLMFKAQSYISKLKGNKQGEPKSIIFDPQALNTAGYKDKHFTVSYSVLRNMGRIPIIKSIIETRIEQVLNFFRVQEDKYSTGFRIRPRVYEKGDDNDIKLNKAQEKEIERITKVFMDCGQIDREWNRDSLEDFGRKWVKDCLELDQGTFEIVRQGNNELAEFFATDGSTYRIAETYNEENNPKYADKKDLLVDGYYPSFVQVYQGRILSTFYPWELCFAVRNPCTDIYKNGYGRSELEDLISTVTNLLNADAYNSNYFKIGSNPKGILKVTGNINESRLQEFRSSWESTMSGVQNSHRLPVIEAEKMDFISTQNSNKDMEYGKYYEFLIKLTCAVFKIDPSEINFHLSGSSEQKPMFEGNNEARLKYSKDKGLKPLLRFLERKINKKIIQFINPEYVLEFVGLEAETPEQELENDKEAVQNWATVNEIRRKRKMKDLEGGDIILNPVMIQAKQMEMFGDPESNEFVDDMETEEGEESDNPFSKALENDVNKILTK